MPLPRCIGQVSYHSLKCPSDREILDAIEVLQRAAVAYKIPASAVESSSTQDPGVAVVPSVTVQSLFCVTSPVSHKHYELWSRAERDAIFEKMAGLTGTMTPETNPPVEANAACWAMCCWSCRGQIAYMLDCSSSAVVPRLTRDVDLCFLLSDGIR